ncbi:VTC domain-containing protein [Nocardioides marmoribigeumensis]|jgi:hypothetical protein|uniref:VTC domain-containing protein n=1 Tax=Nocardioides marmoribigeumensis TaxID=433649 RepID=A0ABU2BYH4_9ACTN|nr:VTC domain-containing protein [Nocardioides marmoribigeumensis]MDR7363457.1 hypothetical protein [Nocardioides marmoribigeumensis]
MSDLDLTAPAPLSLEAVTGTASALTRVDRKYVVPVAVAQHLVEELAGSAGVLEIAGRRTTSYLTTYLDTARLTSCREHLQRRRRRWKVRERVYVEDGLRRLEVKLRVGDGRTVKHLSPLAPVREGSGPLLEEDLPTLEGSLGAAGHVVAARTLRPTVTVSYERATLADLDSGTRVTLDTGVVSRLGDGQVWLDPSMVIVETKGHTRPGTADRLLVGAGHRPLALSKYVSAAALLRDDLADNDLRRLRGTVLHVGRDRDRVAS